MLVPFPIPDDFRAFMRTVAEHLDKPASEKFLDKDDAFEHACGHGGRTFGGTSNYNFTYITPDGQERWELALREQQIRDIADGMITEIEGVCDDAVERHNRRQPRGYPLCVWGEFRNDSFRIRSTHELADVLDTMHLAAAEDPRMLRIWSASDDQIVAVVWRDDCALYVVESANSYGTSEGDQSRKGGFPLADHDGGSMVVPWADCIEWSVGRRALVKFSESGDLGPEVSLSGSIPTGFLMMGDFDRAAVIAARGEPPTELSLTSLPGMKPTTNFDLEGDWAIRVLEALEARGFATIDPRAKDALLEQLKNLLKVYGDEAVENIDTADWLANELSRQKGVKDWDASGGDLQHALVRAR